MKCWGTRFGRSRGKNSKITEHEKKQEHAVQSEEQNQVPETDPEMTQMIELVDRVLK